MKIKLTENKQKQGEILGNGHHLGYWMFNEGLFIANFITSYWEHRELMQTAIGLTFTEMKWKIEKAVNS